MNKIDLNKKYRTVGGDKVEIFKIDLVAQYPVLAVITRQNGTQATMTYTEDGFMHTCLHYCDDNLVEILPYEDFKIDEPVMVRVNNTSCWHRRYFAGVAPNGKAKTWDMGRTSWTVDAIGDDFITSTWPQCRRPTPEELARE